MSLHALACEPPASRRLRWWAPLLLVVGLIAFALAPGLIAGDRPFETSLCGDLEQASAACTELERTASAIQADGGDLAEAHKAD
jgi:hypothetical protein